MINVTVRGVVWLHGNRNININEIMIGGTLLTLLEVWSIIINIIHCL